MKYLLAVMVPLAMATACGDRRDAAGSEARRFTPAQKRALDALVSRIRHATRESFAQNDWSILANLYPAGTFDCWTPEFMDGPYSFLSRPGIPEDAEYTAGPVGEFLFAPGQDDSNMHATHFIEIRYERAYLAKCGNDSARIYPQEFFFVRQHGDGFELAHYCPGNPANYLPSGFSARWPMVSAGGAREVVDGMNPAERQALREQLLAEPIPLNAILEFADRHHLSEEQAYFAIDRICELTTPAS